MYKLYSKGLVTQITVNTRESTFNAFSKAVSCNQFGMLHENDPKKDECDFLMFLDNDIIVTPGWDMKLKKAWKDVDILGLKDVKIIGQLPGGIKHLSKDIYKVSGTKARIGKLGGSGLWSVRTNFFREIGYLDLRHLVGRNKCHDQKYWALCEKKTNGRPYIMGIDHMLGIHAGPVVGSVCNVLTRNRTSTNLQELIKFDDKEQMIERMEFDDFYKWAYETIGQRRGW